MLLIAGLIVWVEKLSDAPPNLSNPLPTEPVAASTISADMSSGSGSSTVATAPTGSSSMLGGLMGSSSQTPKERVYTSGTTLTELLGWSSVEATEALYMYILQMEGEEQEKFLTSLPQVGMSQTAMQLPPSLECTLLGAVSRSVAQGHILPPPPLPLRTPRPRTTPATLSQILFDATAPHGPRS